MRAVILRGIAERKLRSALTALAVVLGVAMIAGTYVLTDQINGAFEDIFLKSNKGIDTVVLPKESFKETTGLGSALELNASLVQRIERVPGVTAVSGERDDEGVLVVHGKPIRPTTGSPAFIISYSPPPLEGATRWVAGRAPRAIDEIALDKRVASKHDITVGQRLQVATASGLENVRVSGICDFPANIGGTVIVIDTLAASQRWYGKPGKVTRIIVAGRDGISEQELTKRIRAALAGERVTVKTGTRDAKDNAKDINDQIGRVLQAVLLTFGLIAVLVGSFIIRNTFTITVAQRIREFALLKALGATARQIRVAVLAEALVLGVVASALGLLAGFAVAAAFAALFEAVGAGIPTRGPELTSSAVAASFYIGIGVTVFSALAPARRAMKIPPITALQEGGEMPAGRFARWSWLGSALLVLLGVALIVAGFSAHAMTTNQKLLMTGGGALAVFAAVAMSAKYVVAPIARAVGWPLERITGVTGAVARENAIRNPARTAITSAALMIGVALVVFVGVLAEGLKQSLNDAARGAIRADLVVRSTTFARLPAPVLAVVRGTEGVSAVAPFYIETGRDQRNRSVNVVGTNPVAMQELFEFTWKSGSAGAFSTLGAHGAVVDDQLATARRLKVGSRLDLRMQSGRKSYVTIRAVYDSERGALTGMLLSLPGYHLLSGDSRPIQILAKASSGVSPGVAAKRVADRLEKPYPLAESLSTDDWIKRMEDQINALVYMLYALLSMSVLISLFGIVNTLALSVFERTREIGMLRAIGETRWQVRWMIANESVITAIIGAVLGIVVGLFFAFVIATGLASEGVAFVVPVSQLVVVIALAIVAGVLAAVFPARRAARLDPIEALHYE